MPDPQPEAKPDLLESVMTVILRGLFKALSVCFLVICFEIFEHLLHHEPAKVAVNNIVAGIFGATLGDVIWELWLKRVTARHRFTFMLLGLIAMAVLVAVAQALLQHAPEQSVPSSSSWLYLLFAGLLAGSIACDVVWDDSAKAEWLPRIRAMFSK